MKTHNLLGAALLGLVLSSTASAQTTAPGNVSNTAGLPSTPANGALGPGPSGAVPTNAVTPTTVAPAGTTGPIYPTGVPVRNLDGGTQRADQPIGGNQAVPGAQPTKRLHKGRDKSTPTQ
jgi:hypothetical protein